MINLFGPYITYYNLTHENYLHILFVFLFLGRVYPNMVTDNSFSFINMYGLLWVGFVFSNLWW